METIEKIKAEINRYIESARKAHTPITESNFAHLLSFIESFEKEPDVDLEKEPKLENTFKYYTDRGITISCGELIVSPQEQEPQGLDEAAEEYAISAMDSSPRDWITRDIVESFIAGAKWMAGQGVTIKGEILRYSGSKTIWFEDDSLKGLQDFENGEEVIIQIRKKEE